MATCFAQSSAAIKYVNARRASHGALANVLMLFLFLGLGNIPMAQGADVCITPGFSEDGTGSNNYLSWFLLTVFLGLAILACCLFLRRSVRRIGELEILLTTSRQQIALLERDLAEADGRQNTLAHERDVTMRNSNVLSVVYAELQSAYERRTQAYERARRAFAEQRDAAIELRNALRTSAPYMQDGYEAAVTLAQHFENCPLGGMITIQTESRFWHTDSDCPELYESGHQIQNRVPCPFCAQSDLAEAPRDQDDLNAGVRIVHAPPGINSMADLVPMDEG